MINHLILKAGEAGANSNCKIYYKNNYYYYSKIKGGDSGNIYILNSKFFYRNFSFNKNFLYTKNGFNSRCPNKKGLNSKDLLIIFNNLNYIKLNKLYLILKGNKSFYKDLNKKNFKIIKFLYKILTDILLIGFSNSGKSTFIKNFLNYNIKISYFIRTLKFNKYLINLFYKFKIILYDTIGLINSGYFEKISNFNLAFYILDISFLKLKLKKFFLNLKNINKIFYKNIKFYYKCKWFLFNKSDLLKINIINNYIKNILNKINWFYLYFIISFKNFNESLSIFIFYLKLKREWRNRYTYQI